MSSARSRRRRRAPGLRTVVSTGDKDLTQLVDPHVTLINTMTNETLDEAAVKAKFGVAPEQIIDYLTLVGDCVDNMPGVEKVGPKTAVKWLAQYGSLEGVVAHAHEISGVVGDNLRRRAPGWAGARARHGEARRGAAVQRSDLAPRARGERLAGLFQRFGFKSWLKDVQGKAIPCSRRQPPPRHQHQRTRPPMPRRYDTLFDEQRISRAGSRGSARPRSRVRHRDHLARPVRGPARRHFVLGRARRSGVPRHSPTPIPVRRTSSASNVRSPSSGPGSRTRRKGSSVRTPSTTSTCSRIMA